MEKGTLKYIDSDTTVHEIFSTTDAELVSYDNNGTDTTVADFLSNISARTADVAEKAEKDLSGNVITSTYAPKNSPNFTGTPTAPTANDLDLLTNQVATVAWCNNVFKRFTGIVPENMDTLQEFWDALGHDSDLATTLSTELAKKQDKTDKLTAFSNLTLSADKLILATGENSFSTTALTSTGKSIISSYTDKEIRKALGVYKHLIYDECENVWQLNGSPAVSNGELVLDGASYIRSGNLFSFGSEFTFECFATSIQNSSLAYLEPIITFTPTDDSTQPVLYLRINNGTASDANGPIGSYDFVAYNANFSTFDIIHENVASWGEKKHLAVTFDGEKFSFYVGGVLIGVGNYINPPGSYRFYIGAQAATHARRWQGTLDEVRLSDTCRYTQNFTPETRFEVDEHTLSLLHFD